MKRVWRRKTVGQRRPKRQKLRPRERLTEKVEHFDSLSDDLIKPLFNYIKP